MMLYQRLVTLLFIGTLLLPALACGISLDDPAEIVPPAVETAEEAARVAGNTAQTAAAQASDLSGTAAALATTEGGEALEHLPAGVQLQEITVANGEITIVGHTTSA